MLAREGEILLCTVTKIYYNSVFVHIDQYNKSGMIHISEISPGRIRNISDYVTVGKKIVCKVLRIDKEKGHIDLSLRRVNTMERRNKLDQIKQEQTARKIVEFIAQSLKKKPQDLYTTIETAIAPKYEHVYPFFMDIVQGNVHLKNSKLPPDLARVVEDVVRQRIKPPSVTIGGDYTIKSFEPDGVTIIRTLLQKAWKKANDSTILKYVGGGKYSIRVTAPDYKEAEKVLKNMSDIILKGIPKPGIAEFLRKEIKT